LKINDSHFHLDNSFSSIDEQIDSLLYLSDRFGIQKFGFVYLSTSKFSLEEHVRLLKIFPGSKLIAQVNPIEIKDSNEEIRKLVVLGVDSIKLHPRLDQFSLMKDKVLDFMNEVEKVDMPVYICSFWDGTWDRYGLKIEDYGRLADLFPKIKFLWAHFGGHKILDFMFMLRRRPNVWADISLTQHYFFSGSVFQDLIYSISSLRGERVIFGSDNPESNYESLEKLIHEKLLPSLSDEVSYKLFVENFDLFFSQK
jgi:predicted TIM-barrel fold metal-dependent hydrolase